MPAVTARLANDASKTCRPTLATPLTVAAAPCSAPSTKVLALARALSAVSTTTFAPSFTTERTAAENSSLLLRGSTNRNTDFSASVSTTLLFSFILISYDHGGRDLYAPSIEP